MMMKTKRHNLRGLAVLICSITLALPAMAQEATPAGPGRVKAPVIISDHGFNGVAARTKPDNFKPGNQAVCLDWQHPWNGTDLAGKIMIIPAETGSTHAPLPWIDLVKNQNGPAVVGSPDPLLAIGIIISKEWYGPSIPLIQLSNVELEKVLKDGDVIEILEDGTIQKE
jgi:predicted aconitase with swiveling domain